MKRFMLCVPLLFAGLARAQTPDCLLPSFLLQGNGDVGGPPGYFDNRANQCQTWTVAYQTDGGVTGFTLAFQSATGNLMPGTFSTVTPVTSSPSFGTAQFGVATYNVLSTTGSNTIADFVRVDVSGGGGSGDVRIEIYGYRTGPTGGTGGGGGGGGGTGCPNPCPVEGVTAAGSPPTTPPVLGAGSDGTDIRTLKTDSAGDLLTLQISAPTFTAAQLAVTATAQNLSGLGPSSKSVCVHALIANTINIYAGPSAVTTSTGMEIPPGQGYCWNVNAPTLIYVIASTTGASISYTVTN